MEREPLPREKPCGGGLTPKAWPLLPVAIDDLVLNRADAVRVHAGRGVSARFRARHWAIWMVRRPELDLRLAREAARRGADLHEGETFRTLDREGGLCVVSGNASYRARVVIGADGAESRVARLLGLPRPSRWMVALETEVEVEGDPLAGEAIVDLGIPHGYAWVFPKGRLYNVGLGTFHPGRTRELRWRFRRFVEDTGLFANRTLAPVGHRIPTGLPPGPLHRDNVLLVGDAAGVADPYFGEGISYALLTAHLASDAVVEYLTGRSRDLSHYSRRVKAALGADMRLWRLAAAALHRCPGLALRILDASDALQARVERTIAGESGFCRHWRGEDAR